MRFHQKPLYCTSIYFAVSGLLTANHETTILFCIVPCTYSNRSTSAQCQLECSEIPSKEKKSKIFSEKRVQKKAQEKRYMCETCKKQSYTQTYRPTSSQKRKQLEVNLEEEIKAELLAVSWRWMIFWFDCVRAVPCCCLNGSLIFQPFGGLVWNLV